MKYNWQKKYTKDEIELLLNFYQMSEGYQWMCYRARLAFGRYKTLIFIPSLILNSAGTLLNALDGAGEALRFINMAIMALSTGMITATNFLKYSEKENFFGTQRSKFSKIQAIIKTELASPDEKVNKEDFITDIKQQFMALEDDNTFPYPENLVIEYSKKKEGMDVAMPGICNGLDRDMEKILGAETIERVPSVRISRDDLDCEITEALNSSDEIAVSDEIRLDIKGMKRNMDDTDAVST